MKVTVLGCGTSGGVPQVGLGWGDCDPAEPKNRRKRCSVLVECGNTTILIDTSPDCREQLLDVDVSRIDAVLYTHAHADHCHGIDEMRWVCVARGQALPVYSNAETIQQLEERFPYCFAPLSPGANGYIYKPLLDARIVEEGKVFRVKNLEIVPFEQDHGHSTTLGFRIGSFAYSTDVVNLDDAAFDALEGVDTWVVDALQLTAHPTHAHLDKTLSWIERVQPRHAVLTHMNTRMDYNSIKQSLPDGVEPGYDGLVLSPQ